MVLHPHTKLRFIIHGLPFIGKGLDFRDFVFRGMDFGFVILGVGLRVKALRVWNARWVARSVPLGQRGDVGCGLNLHRHVLLVPCIVSVIQCVQGLGFRVQDLGYRVIGLVGV